MEETIHLEELIKLLKRYLWLILTSLFIGLGSASLFTTYFIVPQYRSASALIIMASPSENGTINLNELNANILLLNTYKDFIKQGSVVLEGVQKKLQEEKQLSMSLGELGEAVQIVQQQNSQMFQITATTSNPEISALIANLTSEIFQDEIKDVIEIDRISIISKAEPSKVPISPNFKLNCLIGAALGLVIGVILAFLSEWMYPLLRNEEYITAELGLPLLGHLSEIPENERMKISDYRLQGLRNKRRKLRRRGLQ